MDLSVLEACRDIGDEDFHVAILICLFKLNTYIKLNNRCQCTATCFFTRIEWVDKAAYVKYFSVTFKTSFLPIVCCFSSHWVFMPPFQVLLDGLPGKRLPSTSYGERVSVTIFFLSTSIFAEFPSVQHQINPPNGASYPFPAKSYSSKAFQKMGCLFKRYSRITFIVLSPDLVMIYDWDVCVPKMPLYGLVLWKISVFSSLFGGQNHETAGLENIKAVYKLYENVSILTGGAFYITWLAGFAAKYTVKKEYSNLY